MGRSSPLFQLYLTRLREFYRQPARIFWVYGFPILLAIVLGLAFKNRPPEPVAVDLIDGDGASAVETSIDTYNARLHSSEGTKNVRRDRPPILVHKLPEAEALKRLRTGKTALVVLADAGKSQPVTYRFDPTRPEATIARRVIDDVLQEAAGRTNPRPAEDLYVTEPGSRYIDFLIPGLIAINAMGGGMWGIGFLLVNYRIGKLLKCLVATPMPKRDFLLAVMGARLTFLIPDLTILLLLGKLMFDMPIRGNVALILLVDVFGALAFAGIGLLIASRTSTTETVSGLMNLVMLPMWLFSGVFFSAERFPAAAQPFIQALPLTQLVQALRAIILEGAGLFDVAIPLLILGAWTVVTFYLALRLFRWT
ncbi:MAG: ABC transporter [Planctomycetes bacterium SCN 63-9]|nr:MAG: ABC transporter [Planctomycetes bacterium SCN 63-9]